MPGRFPGKKLGNRNAEDRRKHLKGAERHIPLTTLDGTNVGAVQPTHIRELFLRQAVRLAVRADVRGQGGREGGTRFAKCFWSFHPTGACVIAHQCLEKMPMNLQTVSSDAALSGAPSQGSKNVGCPPAWPCGGPGRLNSLTLQGAMTAHANAQELATSGMTSPTSMNLRVWLS